MIGLVEMRPITIGNSQFTAITVKLPKTNFMAITGENGYIMCGALDVTLLSTYLADRQIMAARALGIKTIDELLEAPLESVTQEAENVGVTAGTLGKDALLKMNEVGR